MKNQAVRIILQIFYGFFKTKQRQTSDEALTSQQKDIIMALSPSMPLFRGLPVHVPQVVMTMQSVTVSNEMLLSNCSMHTYTV